MQINRDDCGFWRLFTRSGLLTMFGFPVGIFKKINSFITTTCYSRPLLTLTMCGQEEAKRRSQNTILFDPFFFYGRNDSHEFLLNYFNYSR